MEDNVPSDREITEPRRIALTDADGLVTTPTSSNDPADEIPVPIAMSPAEIDERAQAVEAVRGTTPDGTSSDATDTSPRLDD
jgi:hypothetical protein